MMTPKTARGSLRTTCTSQSSAQGWLQADNTRDGARDVIEEYFEELGGRPEQPAKGAQKRKGRQSGVKSESGTPASTKRVKHEKSWSPPPGSWEHDVDFIDTVEERMDPKTGKLEKYVYVNWKNDRKTQHPLHHIYTKCPQKVRYNIT